MNALMPILSGTLFSLICEKGANLLQNKAFLSPIKMVTIFNEFQDF